MRVKIVYVPTADLRGPDLTRIGTVEDVDPEIGRVMLHEGTAVAVDDDAEVAEPAQPQTMPEQPVVGTPVLSAEELGGKTKAELLDYATERGVEVPHGATKAEIVELLAPTEAPSS